MLVDAGPDLRAQALTHRIRRVDAILFTHGHADHILGLDDVRRFNCMQQRPMPCYGDARTIADIRQTFAYAFDPGDPEGRRAAAARDVHDRTAPFCVGRQEIVPVPLFHGARPILGLRFGALRLPDRLQPHPGRVVAAARRARRARASTRCATGRTRRISRSTRRSTRAAASAPRRTYFTHMCHDLPHAATCARLPAGMELAYDGLVIEVGSRLS